MLFAIFPINLTPQITSKKFAIYHWITNSGPPQNFFSHTDDLKILLKTWLICVFFSTVDSHLVLLTPH